MKTITLTNTASLVRTIIRWDIGMTRKCVSTTSAVRTVQGKVVTALLRMMIFPPRARKEAIEEDAVMKDQELQWCIHWKQIKRHRF